MNKTHRRLKRWLKDEGLTQKDLADQLGISAPYLCMILKRDRVPPIEIAIKLEDITGITVREFAGVL